MFRFVKDGKTIFTEHFVLAEDNGSLTLKLKHFDAAFNGWEEKDKHVAFQLIKAEKDAAYFGGLTFRKTADGLDVFVAVRERREADRGPLQVQAGQAGRPLMPTVRRFAVAYLALQGVGALGWWAALILWPEVRVHFLPVGRRIRPCSRSRLRTCCCSRSAPWRRPWASPAGPPGRGRCCSSTAARRCTPGCTA